MEKKIDKDLSRAQQKIQAFRKQKELEKRLIKNKKTAYAKFSEKDVFTDLMGKLELQIERWDRLAREGKGIKFETEGEPIEYNLTNEERISAMDKAEALKEYKGLIDGLLPTKE